jgi:pilus assembly protein CpaB
MLCCALVCGGLAASQVRERERRAEAAIGPVVPEVVAAHDLAAERRLRPGDLELRRMPARFVPRDALGSAEGLAGARLTVAVAAGSYLTAGLLQSLAGAEARGLRTGERAVELQVGGGSALAGAGPGSRVDVVVSTQPGASGGRTFVALEDAELMGMRAGGGDGAALATLRVTARQALYLTAAATFAHDVRLLLRPPGDRKRIGAAAVSESGL